MVHSKMKFCAKKEDKIIIPDISRHFDRCYYSRPHSRISDQYIQPNMRK